MADRFDVAARLAEGRPAAEHTQSYVWACQVLGYQHPDLTVHASQVRDWYHSEDGLDLHVLDGDCAALWAAVGAIEEALRIQRAQIAGLAAAWMGPGADSAAQFLQRHCDAGHTVAARVRAAAEGCAALRDDLWRLVDSKVATAIAVDDRRAAQRPAWLAAAQAVISGVGDPSAADEIVDQQVKPFVDNDIRTDWLTAMRSTQVSVAASYDAVTDRLAAAPAACFEIPDDLGPSCQLSYEPATPMVTASVAPAAASAVSPPVDTTSDAPEAMPEDLVSAAPLDPLPPIPLTPPSLPAGALEGLPPPPPISDLAGPLGDAAGLPTGAGSPGGLGGLSGLGGLASRIVDAIGGLVGSLTEGLGDPSGFDDSPSDDPLDTDDALDEADDGGVPPACGGEADDEAAGEADDTDDANAGTGNDNPPEAEEVADGSTAQEGTAPPVDGPPPTAAPPTGEPSPPAPPDSQSDGSTPCEIAADELPQAGQ